MSNAMSLKAKIKNLAAEKKLPAQIVMQNYMFERFLFRLSNTPYRDKFILKGGMLVAALVGLDNRATMDLDATLKNFPLTQETISRALSEICDVVCDDGVSFELGNISSIRDEDIYGGYRVGIKARYDTIVMLLSIDISTGDKITPHAVELNFYEMFDSKKSFKLWAYNTETVLAEKIETILRRTVFNTRPRDFYDAYILVTTQKIDKSVFLAALQATAEHRKTSEQIADISSILQTVSDSEELKSMWEKYRKQFTYAKDISYGDIMNKISELVK